VRLEQSTAGISTGLAGRTNSWRPLGRLAGSTEVLSEDERARSRAS